MRSLLVVLALAMPAAADDLAEAKRAWAAAERERDEAKAVPLWEAAARAYEAAAAGKHREAAHAAVLAWQKAIALAAPEPAITARERRLVDAIAVYLPLAPPAERPGLNLLRANTLFRRDRLDDAIPIFQAIVLAHPRSDAAGYAASLMLDAFNRKGDFVALREWTIKLRAMPALVAKRRELADTLARLHLRILAKEAHDAEQAGDHRRCGTTLREAARIAPRGERTDELLYNAGVCFARAGENAAAIHALRLVEKQKTPLSPRAKQRADELQRSK